VQVACDLAQRPFFDQVKAVNLVDLIGGEHGAIFIYKESPALEPEGCSLQDPGGNGAIR
jgi:hypothetical protein